MINVLNVLRSLEISVLGAIEINTIQEHVVRKFRVELHEEKKCHFMARKKSKIDVW